MVKVTKEHNWGQNDVVNIQTKEGNFYISFEKDLNLYFSYLGNNVEDKDDYTFIIDQYSGYVYNCFDMLYDSVMSEKPYKYSDNLLDTEHVYPLSKCALELVHDDGVIEWHSDDCKDYDLSSVLSIERGLGFYKVGFKKSKEKNDPSAFSVCIKNGNSGYDPYNVSFMIMYNKLRDYDFELEKKCEDKKNKIRKR